MSEETKPEAFPCTHFTQSLAISDEPREVKYEGTYRNIPDPTFNVDAAQAQLAKWNEAEAEVEAVMEKHGAEIVGSYEESGYLEYPWSTERCAIESQLQYGPFYRVAGTGALNAMMALTRTSLIERMADDFIFYGGTKWKPL